MSSPAPLRLDFNAEPSPASSSADELETISQPSTPSAPTPRSPTIFGEEDELPPTWSEGSSIFHTWAKCTRLQSIRRNRRITGNPGLREHCLNCISIAATHRRG